MNEREKWAFIARVWMEKDERPYSDMKDAIDQLLIVERKRVLGEIKNVLVRNKKDALSYYMSDNKEAIEIIKKYGG